ncbi:hypothetical protein TREAZ_1355 [Leadbettera azotonutricia ZAS-9]|uniref:Uncharacterized protein n=1 Tax=Leadbettera azotonutricia (strain ATCC BAA-888 / DSM 13862 / ZAS-9) TaxID=545695 RepID=F5YFE6_LEAAZ|nr:hypothetical protein TREAZ_1355 [Leadbettera azotonutricia ZAS-9]
MPLKVSKFFQIYPLDAGIASRSNLLYIHNAKFAIIFL